MRCGSLHATRVAHWRAVVTLIGGARDRLHRVVAVALPDVVAFDLSIAAQVFGHRGERERYAFTMCAERPGAITSTTGFTVNAPAGLEARGDADTVIVPDYYPLHDPSPHWSQCVKPCRATGITPTKPADL